MLRASILSLVCAIAYAVTPQQCQDMLKTALSEKNPDVRKQAVVALSLVEAQPAYFKMLEDALSDKDVEVRMAAVSSLSEIRNERATAALRKAAQDDVPEVAFSAARALLARGNPAGKEAMLSVLEGETRTSSNFFTKQKRDAMRMMHTPKSTFFYALRQGIGFVPVPGIGTGVASMQSLMSDPGVSGRATAALLLGHERDLRTLNALKDALTDRDWSVRAAAVHSLALRNDPSLRDEFAPLLDDKKEAVRLRAAAAWLRLSGLRRKPAAAVPAAPAPAPAKP